MIGDGSGQATVTSSSHRAANRATVSDLPQNEAEGSLRQEGAGGTSEAAPHGHARSAGGLLAAGTGHHAFPQGKRVSQSIRNATVVADFYSFDSEGSPDDAVEGWLASVVERDFTRLLPGLREGEQPTREMHPAIARFLAAAVVRTRTARSLRGTD